MVLLNVQKPYLRDPAFRRQLNAAIDRDALVADALKGHGTPADQCRVASSLGLHGATFRGSVTIRIPSLAPLGGT